MRKVNVRVGIQVGDFIEIHVTRQGVAMTPGTIRNAVPEDYPSLLRVETACFDSDRLSARQMKYWITNPAGIFQVATTAEQLVGYALAFTRCDSPAARLYSLALLPEARGLGLAAGLVDSIERNARTRGLGSVRLEVAVTNQPAIRLYEKLGYSLFEKRTGYYENGSDAWRMQKFLD